MTPFCTMYSLKNFPLAFILLTFAEKNETKDIFPTIVIDFIQDLG